MTSASLCKPSHLSHIIEILFHFTYISVDYRQGTDLHITRSQENNNIK